MDQPGHPKLEVVTKSIGAGKLSVNVKVVAMHALSEQMNSDACQSCDVFAVGRGVALTFTIFKSRIVEDSVPVTIFG